MPDVAESHGARRGLRSRADEGRPARRTIATAGEDGASEARGSTGDASRVAQDGVVSNSRHWRGVPKAGHSEEYLSVTELARRIPYAPKTMRNLMCRGVFLEGVHYTRLSGRPIFFWSRVEALLREGIHRRKGEVPLPCA